MTDILPPHPSSRVRSLLSRLSSPFVSQFRNVCDFHILTSDPHRRYAPGDVVRGAVFLTVVKPIKITHITLSLYGFVKVFKNFNAPGGGISKELSYPSAGQREQDSGHHAFAPLFETEQVLCGDGRLDRNKYKFEFEIPFPSTRLPSSLDFERGTITYLLTATLTRPTAIAPTLSCERKVHLMEILDIAQLDQPKPHIFTLAPVAKQRRTKNTCKETDSTVHVDGLVPIPAQDRPFSPESVRASQTSYSPAPSEITAASNVSTSIDYRVSSRSSSVSDAGGSPGLPTHKIIRATAELLRKGYLPGDAVLVRVSVDHTKMIKSMRGIIITLYRIGRIDLQPVLPQSRLATPKQPGDEDLYPKSRTGLGGLTFSSKTTNHAFRMDLAQNSAPLLVDPQSLKAVVKTSLQIPDEEIFPTISCVPGAMIDFRYYVEVIIDVHGKLTDQDRILPRMTTQPAHGFGAPNSKYGIQSKTGSYGFIDTEILRRERNVIACNFEVVIGTSDSQRKNNRKLGDPWEDRNQVVVPQLPEIRLPGQHDPRQVQSEGTVGAGTSANGRPQSVQGRGYQHEAYEQPAGSQQRRYFVPPPEAEGPADEKARLRQAEEMLMPSAPPVEEGAFTSAAAALRPSAPTVEDIGGTYLTSGHSVPAYIGSPSTSVMTARPDHAAGENVGTNDAVFEATAMEAGEDKQELECRRLLAIASSPDDCDRDGERNSAAANMVRPTAPVFDQEDHEWAEAEYLPRYQRH